MKPLLSKVELRDLILNSGFEYMRRYVEVQLDRFFHSYVFLATRLPEMQNAVLMDVGSCDGVFLPAIHTLGRFSEYHILDCNLPAAPKSIINTPSGRIVVCNHVANVERDSLPFQDNTLDVVFLGEVIEHLQHDPMAALLEINRILKPEGLLFISTPNTVSAQALSRLLKGIHPGQAPGYWPESVSFLSHTHEYTDSEIRRLFHCSGFAIVAHETAPRPNFKLGLATLILRLLARSPARMNELGETMLFLARKTKAVNKSSLNIEERYPEPVYCTDRFT